MANFKDVLELVDKVSQPLKKIAENTEKTTKKTEKLKEAFDKLGSGKLTNALSQMKAKFVSVGNTISKVAKAYTVISGAISLVGGAVMRASQKYADLGDRIDKMSQKIGMGRKSFQEWDYIKSQNGGNVESLQMGFKTLTTQIEGVQKGSKDSIKAFSALGVKVKENNGQFRKADDVFNDVIRKLQKIKDPTQKMILANRLFGRSAAELRPLLNKEADAIDNLREKANKLGLIISDEDVDNAVKYKDTMDTFSRFFEAKFATIAMKAMPEFSKSLEEIMSIMQENQDVIEGIGQSLKWTFTVALPAIIKSVMFIANAFKFVGEVVGNILGYILTVPMRISIAFDKLKASTVSTFVSVGNSISQMFDKIIQKIIQIAGKLPIIGNAIKNSGLASSIGGGISNSYRQNNISNTNNSTVTNNNYFGNTNNYGGLMPLSSQYAI